MMRRRKPSTSSSMFGVFLLMLIVLVTLAGIGTAIYLQGSGEFAQTARISRDATIVARDDSPPPPLEPTSPPPRKAEGPPPPPELPATTTAMPAIEPAAGPSSNDAPADISPAEPSPAPSTAPQQTAALEAPATANSPPEPPQATVQNTLESVSKDGFWIEYGVYVGRRYAERLQRSLGAIGLDAEITTAHTPKGRALLRVRSPAIADRAAARAMARKAEHALGIATLIHTTAIAAPQTAMVARSSKSDGPYWVQFGAFAHSAPAKGLQDTLKRGGVATVLSKTTTTHHKPLFVIRSIKIGSLHAALTVAARGNEVMRSGHALVARHPMATHKHAGRSVRPHPRHGSS